MTGILANKRLLVLAGEAGTGKTTLLRKLMEKLRGAVRFVYLNYANLQFDDLLGLICNNLGVVAAPGDRMAVLTRFLAQQRKAHGSVVLVVDEAQNLPPQVFDHLHPFIGGETSRPPLLPILLAGQLGLLERLEEAGDLKGRVDAWCRLDPLPATPFPTTRCAGLSTTVFASPATRAKPS